MLDLSYFCAIGTSSTHMQRTRPSRRLDILVMRLIPYYHGRCCGSSLAHLKFNFLCSCVVAPRTYALLMYCVTLSKCRSFCFLGSLTVEESRAMAFEWMFRMQRAAAAVLLVTVYTGELLLSYLCPFWDTLLCVNRKAKQQL